MPVTAVSARQSLASTSSLRWYLRQGHLHSLVPTSAWCRLRSLNYPHSLSIQHNLSLQSSVWSAVRSDPRLQSVGRILQPTSPARARTFNHNFVTTMFSDLSPRVYQLSFIPLEIIWPSSYGISHYGPPMFIHHTTPQTRLYEPLLAQSSSALTAILVHRTFPRIQH